MGRIQLQKHYNKLLENHPYGHICVRLNFKPYSPSPHPWASPGGDLTLTLIPIPDIEVEFFPIFVANAWNHTCYYLKSQQRNTWLKCAVKSPTRAWGHSGDLTADLALEMGQLMTRFVKSPVFPTLPGVGHKIDKCISILQVLAIDFIPLANESFLFANEFVSWLLNSVENSSITILAVGVNMKTRCSSCRLKKFATTSLVS